MFIIKRNQVIITALVIMIAVAGYLNYVDGRGSGTNQMMLSDEGEIVALVPEDTVEAGKMSASEIGEALTMNDDPTISMELAEGTEATEAGEAIFVNNSADASYFVQARLEREQARAKQKEILTEMINNGNIEQVKRAECADVMLSIQKRIEKETAAEAMIEAKGFKDVYVRIDDDTVDVVVSKEALSDAEIAQIEDIVKRKTGMETSQIRISTMKG